MFILYFITLTFAADLSAISCENAYCTSCDTTTKKCTGCISGYLLINGECKYMRDEHCNNALSNSAFCTQCLIGYKLNQTTAKCEAGKESCVSVQYYRNNDNIKITCNQYSCDTKEVLTSKGCIDCSSNPYCNKLANDATNCGKCTECKQGTNYVNGKCEVVDKYCKDFTTSTKDGHKVYTCSKCADGYVFDSNKRCVKGTFEKCLTYSKTGNCDVCMTYGAIENGKCTNKCNVENCAICRAQNINECHECKEGYAFIDGPTSDTCFKLPDHCAKGYLVDVNKTECSTCMKGYTFDSNHQCIKLDENCSGSLNGICRACKSGYHLDGNTCKANPEHCQVYYASSKQCSMCDEGYIYNSTAKGCISCTGDCATCSMKTDSCMKCKDTNKEAYNGKCYTIIKGCKEYNENGSCKKCDDLNSYTSTSDGKCQTDGCKTKDTASGKCTSCIGGYFMTKDYKCSKCNDKCSYGCIHTESSCIPDEDEKEKKCHQYNTEGQCAKCEKGYELVNSGCVKQTTNNVNQKYQCYSTTFDGLCTIYLNTADGTFSYANENGEYNEGGNNNGKENGSKSIITTVLFFVVLLMTLF